MIMTSAHRGVRFYGWLIMRWLSILFTAATAVGQARLGVPSYQDPGSPQGTAWAAPGAKAVGVMIVNLNNGEDETYYPNVDRAIRATGKQGIFVLGYTYTGYGAARLDMPHSHANVAPPDIKNGRPASIVAGVHTLIILLPKISAQRYDPVGAFLVRAGLVRPESWRAHII